MQDLNGGDVIVKRFVVSQMPAVKLRFDPLHPRLVVINISRIIITQTRLAISVQKINTTTPPKSRGRNEPLATPPLLTRIVAHLLMLADDGIVVIGTARYH